jgi:electron transfer flavoprotein alpha subunit
MPPPWFSEVNLLLCQVAAKKLKEVYTVSSRLKHTQPTAFARIPAGDRKTSPLVLMTHTYEVRDFAPKLAARSRGFCGDCIPYKVEAGSAVYTRQAFQGKLVADVVPLVSATLR